MDNTINSLVSKAVGFTDQQVKDYFLSNPNLNDAQIFDAMKTFGVSPSQVASATGTPLKNIISRLTPFLPQSEAVLLGDTWVQGNYRTSGSGEDQQIGPLESIAIYKTPGGRNDKIPVGTEVQSYLPNGELVNTTQTKKDLSFFGGIKEALKDPYVQAAILGVAGGAGAFDGLLSGTGAAGTGAGSAFELANAGAGAFEGGTALNSLAGTGAGSAFELANAGASANTVGGTTLSNLANANTVGTAAGSTLANAAGTVAGTAAGSTLANTAGSALGTTVAQGLALNAIGNVAGTVANQQGITDARNLINQYGTQAGTALNNAYTNAQNLGAANRTDLGNVYQNLNTNLNNTINAQAGLYGQTNTNLANNYSNTLGNLQNLYNQQVGYQQPYQQIGNQGASGLNANKDYFTRQFTNADLNANLAPNYAFQLQQGQMANQRAANMGGGSMGGNALQGLQRYTQDYAGGAYQNAFNNFNTQRQNIYGNLSGMAQIGSTSAGQLANLGNTFASNLGSLSSNYGGNMLSNAGQLQTGYNQYGSNLTGAANTYGGNLTTGAGQGMNAANVYGLNAANLATGIGGALASNATAAGANNATALSNLGNTALLGSMIKAT